MRSTVSFRSSPLEPNCWPTSDDTLVNSVLTLCEKIFIRNLWHRSLRSIDGLYLDIDCIQRNITARLILADAVQRRQQRLAAQSAIVAAMTVLTLDYPPGAVTLYATARVAMLDSI